MQLSESALLLRLYSLKYNVLVSCAFVTLEQFQPKNNAFLRNIRQEGIAVWHLSNKGC